MTAFKNPDGSLVQVMLNCTEKDLSVVIRVQGKLVQFDVPKNSIATALL